MCSNSNDELITIEYVMRDLCEPRYKNEQPNRKGEVAIYCPLKPTKIFEVNVRKNVWNCFKKCANCPCGGSGGPLDLYSLFFGGDWRDAYNSIIKTIEGAPQTAIRRKAESLPVLKERIVAADDVLDDTYNALLDMLTLSDKHRAHLLGRGLSEQDIEAMKFRSVPSEGFDIIAAMLADNDKVLQGVPGFYISCGIPRMVPCDSGIFIPYRNSTGQIVGLQIRYDFDFAPGLSAEAIKKLKQRRYRWFSSSCEDNGTSASNVPFWGIPGRELKEVVYATEGGLKAATAQSLSGGSFVAIPGVTCFSTWENLLIGLKRFGVKNLVDAFDSDRATNPNVMDAIKKLHSIAREYGYEMKSWDWGTEQKGVDDYLLAKKKARKNN